MSDQERETTSGTGRLLSLFFGTVALCAAFFVLGYSLGKNSATAANTPADTTVTTGAAATQSAAGVAPAATFDCTSAPGGCPTIPDAETGKAAHETANAVHETAANPAPAPPPPAPALPAPPRNPAAPAAEAVKTAIPSGYVVQVAALSKQQDAQALLAALRKKQYPVFIVTPSTDNLFHVQIGPFGSPKEAEMVRNHLVTDGYSPILKR